MAWLNFACGALEVNGPLDTDGNGTADAVFSDVVRQAELVRLDPGASEQDLMRQAQVVHHIREAATDPARGTQVVVGG